MLDIDQIRRLVDMMVANDLVEISLRDGDVEVSLRRPNHNSPGAGSGGASISPALPATPPDHPASAGGSGEPADEGEAVELTPIKSPMVGTFYAAADPDSPPFVQAGASIHADSVVCIVEAMKVFNEIKAEVTGTVERVLVKDKQPVEYGQPLFLVRPG